MQERDGGDAGEGWRGCRKRDGGDAREGWRGCRKRDGGNAGRGMEGMQEREPLPPFHHHHLPHAPSSSIFYLT